MGIWINNIAYKVGLSLFAIRVSMFSRFSYWDVINMVRELAKPFPQSAGQTETLGPATTWYDDCDPYDPPEEYQGA